MQVFNYRNHYRCPFTVGDSMDVLFHGLVGAIIGECAPKSIKNRRTKGALAAMSPDLANIPLYLYLGMKTDSFMWIPSADAFYENVWILEHWSWMLWNISHSFLFLGLILAPIIYRSRHSNLISVGYLSHLLLDIPSHSGVWSVKPMWPIGGYSPGWFDAWAWNAEQILTYSMLPLIAWVFIKYLRDYQYIVWPSEVTKRLNNSNKSQRQNN